MKKINKISEKIQKIKVIKNGPYFVSGNIKLQEQIITVDSNQVPVKWSKGVKYSNKELYALCRFG